MVDIEVSRLAEKRMTKDGILFRLGAKVSRVKDDTVYYEFGGQNCQVKSDMVLMGVGRVPNTQGLNAEGIGIEFDRKAIRTDAHMRTNIPHIYAIGDVNGKVMRPTPPPTRVWWQWRTSAAKGRRCAMTGSHPVSIWSLRSPASASPRPRPGRSTATD